MVRLPAGLDALECWKREDLARPTLDVAPALLGSYLVRVLDDEWLIGRIVETEAYLALEDPASHSFRGESARNRPMFGPAGHAYVYRIYGMHMCVNVVTEGVGVGAAVLIRALEPIAGEETMIRRRGRPDVTNGPAKLCAALGIDLSLNDIDLTVRGPLFLLRGEPVPEAAIARTPRVGITKAADRPWRFLVKDSRWVSRGPLAKLL